MVITTEHNVLTRKEFELINITEQVEEDVKNSGVKNGVVFVITRHTTTGITSNEALPCVEKDLEIKLEELVPKHAEYVHTHMLPTYGTCSGNSPGHVKQMLVGNHCVYPVLDGKMSTGSEQKIYFAEFDGLQQRRYVTVVMGE